MRCILVLSLSTLFPSVLEFPKQFFTVRIMRSNSSKVNKFNQQQRVIQVTAAERGREEAAHIARRDEWEFTERGTCGTVRKNLKFTLNILEADATKLMLEECTSSSRDKQQLAVNFLCTI